MSHRGKRPMPESEAFPPTKKRKGRPTSSQTSAYVHEEDANHNSNSNVSPSQSWQPRSLMDLKMSSIYNRSAAEAPAELFRKDLISAMKLPDSEPLSADEYWVISDQWKQEWERGVQVPVNPDSLPEPSVSHTRRALYEKGRSDFKLPKNKFIHVMKTDNFSHDQHYLSNTPALADSVCFYDLDQSDDAWLKLYNRERNLMGLPPVTEEQFERVIEELESRCWNKIHAIMKNEEGLGIEFDENVICDVCRSPDSEEANEMVFCDNCNICVHQACYGITAIPSGQWLCRTCSMGQKPDCVLCPNKGGAMKSTRSGQKWAHVSCALWIPEVSIGSVDRMEPITKISNIPQSRWALICVLCRERVGACIQCSVKTCKTAYHVTCAFQHGLEMRAIIEDESAEDGVKLRSYCQKHGVNKGKKSSSTGGGGGGSSTNKTSNNSSGSEDEGCGGGGADNESHHSSTVSNKTAVATTSAQRKHRKEMTSEERNQARVLRLTEVEAEFDKHVNIKDISCHLLDIDQEGINAIYFYWILKRKSGNNRPLLPPKSDDVEILSHTQEQADVEKLKSFVHLRQDLERVRNLCYMVSRREKLSRSFFKMREQTFHKQLAVLADMKSHHQRHDEPMQNYETVIMAVLAANHGPCIYDQLYSATPSEAVGADGLTAPGSSSTISTGISLGSGNYKHKDMNTLLDNLLGESLSSSVEDLNGSGVEVITTKGASGKGKNTSSSSGGPVGKKLKNRRTSSSETVAATKQKQNNSIKNSSSARKNNNNNSSKTNSSSSSGFNNQKRRPSALYNGGLNATAALSTRSGTLYGSSSSATTSSCTSDDDTDNSSNTNHSVKMLMPPPRSTSTSSCTDDEEADGKKARPVKQAPAPTVTKPKKVVDEKLATPAPRGRGRPPKVVPKIDRTRLTDSSSDDEKARPKDKVANDSLRPFERAMFGGDVHLTDSNDSDELDVPNKNLQSMSKNKLLSTKIYSSDTDDSSAGGGSSFTTDKEKTDNAATSDSQQHLVRTKAAMKEFNLYAAAASMADPAKSQTQQNKVAGKGRKGAEVATSPPPPPDRKKANASADKKKAEAEALRKKLELEKETQRKLEQEAQQRKKLEAAAEKEAQRKKLEAEASAAAALRKKQQQDQEREQQRKKQEATEKERKRLQEQENQKKKLAATEQEKDIQRKKLLEIEREKENQKKLASVMDADIPVDLLVVPQRQAAKKAFENLTRSGTATLPGQIGSTNSTTPSRRDSVQSGSASKDDVVVAQPRATKENLKDTNKESSRKESKKSAPKPLKLHQKDKSRKADDDELNAEEPEAGVNTEVATKSKGKANKLESNFNSFAYVPQRQAAKKAQEHIKSGLGNAPLATTTAVPEVKTPPKSQSHGRRAHGGRKDSKTAASDISSSDSSSSSDSNDSHDSNGEEDEDQDATNGRQRGGVKKKNEGTERNNDLPFLDKVAKSTVSGSGTSESSDDTSDDSDESSSSANSSRSNQSAHHGTATTKKPPTLSTTSPKKSATVTDKGESPVADGKKSTPSIRDEPVKNSLATTPTTASSPTVEGTKSRSQRTRRDSNRTGQQSAGATPTTRKEEILTDSRRSRESHLDDTNKAPAAELSNDKHGSADARKGDLVAAETKLIAGEESSPSTRKRKSRNSSSTTATPAEPAPVVESPTRKVSPRKSPVKSRRDSIGTPTRSKAPTKELSDNALVTKDEPVESTPAPPPPPPPVVEPAVLVDEKRDVKIVEDEKLVSIVIDDDDDDVKDNKVTDGNKLPETPIKGDEKYTGHCNLFDINSEDLFQNAVEPINDDAFTISNDSLSAGGFSLSSSATATALKKDLEDEEDTARETLNLVEKLRQKKRKCSSAGVPAACTTGDDKAGKENKKEETQEKELLQPKTPRIDFASDGGSKENEQPSNRVTRDQKSSPAVNLPPPSSQQPSDNQFGEAGRWIPVASCNVDVAPPTPDLPAVAKTMDELHESNSNQSAIADVNKIQNKLLNSVMDYDDDKPVQSPYSYQRKWMDCEIIAKRRSVSSSPASSNSDMVIDSQPPVESQQKAPAQLQHNSDNFINDKASHKTMGMFEQQQQLFANLTNQGRQQQRNVNSLFHNSFMEAQHQNQHQHQHQQQQPLHHQFPGSGSAITPFPPSGGLNMMPLASPGQALYPPHINSQSNLFTSTLNNLQQHHLQQHLHQQDREQQEQLQQLQQELHNLNNSNNNNNIDYSSTTSAAFTASSQNQAFAASILQQTQAQQQQQQTHDNLLHQQQQGPQQQPTSVQHQQQPQHSIFDNNKKNNTKQLSYNNSTSMNMHLQEENRMNAPNDLFSGAGTGITNVNLNANVAMGGDYPNQASGIVTNKSSPNKAVVAVPDEESPFKPSKQQQKAAAAAEKRLANNEYEECNNKPKNKSTAAKTAKTPKSSGSQATKASNKRGSRGRGRSTSIHHMPPMMPFPDYGLMNENTMHHIAGTVYDFEDEIEREEENRPTRYRKKSKEFSGGLDPALRALASSGDTTPAAASMSPKLPNVNIQLKVRNSDFKSITSLHNSLNNTMETSNSIISPIIDMVLPGPVDMRTYSDDYDTTGVDPTAGTEQTSFANPLDRFATEPAADILEDIKELQSALKHTPKAAAVPVTESVVQEQKMSPIPKDITTTSTGGIETTIEKAAVQEQDSNSTAALPVDEVSIDSDYQPNPKVSLSNQLKLKIKGPLAHPDYYSSAALSSSSSTTTSSTFNHTTTKHTIETVSVAVNMASGETMTSLHGISQATTVMPMNVTASGGSSNLRRMRKKELLRQYWTQDANMDEQNGGVQMGSEHPASGATVPNRMGIPKAVDSMSSLPTKDDYNYEEFIDKKKRKINRELRHIEAFLQDPNSAQERRRSTSSSNGGQGGNNNLTIDTSDFNKRRSRYNRSSGVTTINTSPGSAVGNLQVTPKLKIKIGEGYSNETPLSGLRPPKKRINAVVAAVVPSFEDLKRENMAYRKQIVANFDTEKKSKKHSRSKEERREEKRKKKKEKKKQRVEIINNDNTEASPKLIIKFGIRTKKSEVAAASAAAADLPPPDVSVAPIRLKISKKGVNYVASKSDEKPTPPATIASVLVVETGDDLKAVASASTKTNAIDVPVDVPSKDPSDPLNTSAVVEPHTPAIVADR